MPGRQSSVMPTGRLSIEEKFESVDSLTILIENEDSMVAQINIGKDENGETSVFMMNVNVPWCNPVKGVRLTYNRAFEDKINPISPTISEPEVDNHFCEALVKYEEEMSTEVKSSLERKSMNDSTFEAALKALPKIKTPPSTSEADVESLYSQEELGDLSKFLKISSVGKRYSLRVKSDGGLLADLKSVLNPYTSTKNDAYIISKRYVNVPSTKRNVYIISKPERGSDDPPYTLVLSKTRPKHCVNVRSLPIGVDIWMTKYVPKFKTQPVNNIEYEMLQHIREALVSFFSF
jgi:hypothetical protein